MGWTALRASFLKGRWIAEMRIRLPVSLGYTPKEISELCPKLSLEQIEEIINASYAIEATYDLEAHKYTGIKTSVYYRE